MAILSYFRRDQLTPITVDDETDKGKQFAADLEGAGYYQDEERAKRESESLVGGLNYSGPASSASTPVEEEEPINLSPNQVYLRLPWLKAFAGGNADKLVDAYIKGYIEGDASETAATAAMRGTPEYNTVFPGIVNTETGAIRMTEGSYVAGFEQIKASLVGQGLGGYAKQKGREIYATMVGNQVSPNEYINRVNTVRNRLFDRMDEGMKQNIVSAYNDYYSNELGESVQLEEASILALAIDPNLNQEILQKRLNASELGAVYTTEVGEDVSLERIQEFTQAGVTLGRARTQFAQAATTARLLGSMARRQNRNTTVGTASNVLDATLFKDENLLEEISAIEAQSMSGSSIATGAAQTQSGRVTGLTEN
mgnify:CR=1 FL=1|tara:strand:+ start:69 stop:1172 length:1104 start_codon:yes stop_codon:yes gene_type:complete